MNCSTEPLPPCPLTVWAQGGVARPAGAFTRAPGARERPHVLASAAIEGTPVAILAEIAHAVAARGGAGAAVEGTGAAVLPEVAPRVAARRGAGATVEGARPAGLPGVAAAVATGGAAAPALRRAGAAGFAGLARSVTTSRNGTGAALAGARGAAFLAGGADAVPAGRRRRGAPPIRW